MNDVTNGEPWNLLEEKEITELKDGCGMPEFNFLSISF
jgi:hypothetical protein